MEIPQFNQDLAAFRSAASRLCQSREEMPPQDLAAIAETVSEVEHHFAQAFGHPAGIASGSSDRFRAMVESISDGILAIDRDWRIIYLNKRAAQNGFKDSEDLIGKDMWEAFPELLGSPLEKYYRQVMQDQTLARFEMKGILPDQWYVISVYPSATGITVYWIDHSSSKKVEIEQDRVLGENRRQKALLDAIFEADPGAVAVVAGPDLRIVQVNPAFRFLTLDPFLDPIGQVYETVWPVEKVEGYTAEIRRALETGQPFQATGFKLPLSIGIARTFTFQARRIDWQDEPAVLIILWDTTEQENSTQALRESEQRERARAAELNALMDVIPAFVWVSHDPECREMSSNQYGYDFLRMQAGTNVSLSAPEQEHLPSYKIFKNGNEVPPTELPMQITAATGIPQNGTDFDLVFEDGTVRSLVGNATPLMNAEGRPAGAVGVYLDVTEWRRAEEELIASRENYQRIVETSNEGILIADVSGIITYANPRIAEMLGYSNEELVGKSGTSLVDPAFFASAADRVERRRIGLRGLYEIKLLRKDGTGLWAFASGSPIKNSAGEHIANLGMYVDITARKAAEDQLMAEREWFRTTLSSIGDAVITTDSAGRVTFLNPVAEQLTGWSSPEASGLPLVQVFSVFNEQTGQPAEDPVGEVLRDGRIIGLVNHTALIARDGRQIPIEDSAAPIKDPAGQILGVVMVFRDVTEKRQAEEALRRSEALYRAIGESIDYGVWVCAPDGRNIYASESFLNLVGQTQEECSGFGWGNVLHPDDAERTIAAWKECTRTGGKWDIEHRFRGVDGQWHPILARGVPVRDEQGEITAWAGINLDISGIKDTEDSLREAHARAAWLARFPEENPNPILRISAAGRVLYANRPAAVMPGWQLAAGQDLGDPLLPLVQRALEQGTEINLDIELNENFYFVSVVPFPAEGYANIYARDINKRKRAETLLERYQLLFKRTQDITLFVRVPDGRILEANRAAELAYGYAREELLRLFITDLRAEDTQALIGSQMAQASATGAVFETRHRRKDGSTFPVEVSSVGSEFEGAQVNLSIIRDITQRRQAEEAIQRQNRVMEALNQVLEAGVHSKNDDELGAVCLAIAEKLTGSRFGFIGEIGADGYLHALAMSDPGWEQCKMQDPGGVRSLPDKIAVRGLYRSVLKDGKSLIANEPGSHPDSIGAPEGHPRLTAFLGVPLCLDGNTIGMIALGNRENGYRPEDQETLEALAPAVVESIKRARAERALRLAEERYRTTLSSIGDAVITTDARGRVTYLNPVAEKLTGWWSAEAAGLPLDQVFPIVNEWNGQPAEDPVGKVLGEGGIVELANHTALVSRDGRLIPVEDSAAPIRDTEGQTIGVVMVFHDVSEKRQAEQSLAESQNLLRTVLDEAPDPIFLKDRDSRLLLANRAMLAIIGKPFEEVQGKNDADYYEDAEVARIILENDRLVMESGQTLVIEERVQFLGKELFFLATKTPYRDAAGSVIGLIGLAHNITERKVREVEISKLNRTLQAHNDSSKAMLRTGNEPEYLKEICQIITQDCGHAMVWIGLAEEDEARTIRPVAYAGFEAGYLETLHLTWADTRRGRGPTGTAIREQKPVICRDMLTDPHFLPWREEAQKRGYASSLALPLIADKKAFGAVTIYSRHPDPFSVEEVRLLSGLVDDLAYGIQAIRLREEREKVQAALAESEKRYRSLFEGMTEGFALHEIICDPGGKPVDYRFLEINPAFENLTGLSKDLVLGRRVMEVLPGTESYWIDIYGRVALTGEPAQFRNFSGEIGKHFDVIAFSPERGQFAVLFIDVTERVWAEAENRKLSTDVEIKRRLIEQREQERIQIARDLHDGPVQELIAATYILHGLLMEPLSAEVLKELEEVKNSIHNQVTELRAYAMELRPPILARMGLESTIRSHLEGFQTRHPEMEIHFECSQTDEILPEELRVPLFRIYQESLNNIVKHAGARNVWIKFMRTDSRVVLEVRDDGVGFGSPADWLTLAREGHLGLVGMRERIEAIGGTLEVESSPGNGMMIRAAVTVPAD